GSNRGIVSLHFIPESVLTQRPVRVLQPSAERFIKVVPWSRGAVVEEILVGIDDILFTQIPGQTSIEGGLLLIGQIDTVLPERTLLTLVAAVLPTGWRYSELVVEDSPQKVACEQDIAAAGIEQPPVEYQVGSAVPVGHP